MSRIYIVALSSIALVSTGITLISSSTSAATSKPVTYQLERGKVGFELPVGWSDQKNVLGMPLMLLGPMKDDQRAVISVVPSGINAAFDKDIGDTEFEYRMGRRSFVEKVGGEVLGFRSYQKGKVNGSEAHSMGVRYRVAGNDIAETSWYVFCQQKLYYLQTMTRNPADDSVVEGVAKSFRCQ